MYLKIKKSVMTIVLLEWSLTANAFIAEMRIEN
jgi:hypothetical protein